MSNPSSIIMFGGRGDEAFKKKNFEYAISNYLEVLKRQPDDGEIRKKLFTACRERKRAGQTKMAALDKLVYLPRQKSTTVLVALPVAAFLLWILLPGSDVVGFPLNWIVTLLLLVAAGGMAFLAPWPRLLLLQKKRKHAEALETVSTLLLKEPEHLDLLTVQAQLAAAGGFPESAIAICESILSMVPAYVPALRQLGNLYHEKKDIGRAQQCFNRILQVDRNDIEASRAMKNLAAERTMESGVEKAATTGNYREGLKDVKTSEKLEAQTRVLKTTDEVEQAIGFKKEEISKKPEDWRLWRDLGDLHARLKAWTEAEEAYRKAIALEPVNPTLKMSLGNLALKRFDEQIAAQREALKANPADAASKAKLAQAEKEKLAFSLEEFARRARDLPTDPNVRYDYGEALYRSGKVREAISEFQFSVKDPKRQIPSLLRLGECFKRENQFDLSAKQYERAVENLTSMNETKKMALYALGDVYEKQLRFPEAKKVWDELYEADINFRDITKRLDALNAKLKTG
jgi:tetratricopeptide (TPR) repeat protein